MRRASAHLGQSARRTTRHPARARMGRCAVPRDSECRWPMALRLPGIDPPRARSAWYTPQHAARSAADLCWDQRMRSSLGEPWRVLEPSAGRGALIDALLERCQPDERTMIDAVELDSDAASELADKAIAWPCRVRVHLDDYLERKAPSTPYDLAILNPPYEGGLDSLFMAKAMNESLRVVALLRLALLESKRSHERIWSRIRPGEWWLQYLCPFVSRPAFELDGKPTEPGKTAFMLVAMQRHGYGSTRVEWR